MAQQRETREASNPAFLAVGLRPDVLTWRQQSGVFRSLTSEQRIRVGHKGLADAGLIVAVTITPEMVGRTVGVAVQAEFKTSNGKQSEDQRNWQAAVEKRGGIYRLVRSAADMLKLVEDVQHGRW